MQLLLLLPSKAPLLAGWLLERQIVELSYRRGTYGKEKEGWYGMVWLKKKFRGWMGSVTWDDTFLGLSGLNSFVGHTDG